MKFALVLLATLAIAAAQIDIKSIKPLNLIAPVPVHPDTFQSGRIAGGDEAYPGQFKYQVAVEIIMGEQRAFCGGSILNQYYIITAAHCTDKADAVIVNIGAHNIKDANEKSLKIRVEKENIIVHKDWSMISLTNDISLIKLPQPIEFNDRVQPINLPRKSQAAVDYVGSPVVASGWGKDSDKSTTVSPVLRFVEVPILAPWRCNIRFFGKIKDSHICIKGTGGKSTCQGDSGGPLAFTEEDGSTTLLGLTSFGIAFGCEIGWPGVFTRITYFLDWISENTGIEIRA